MESAVKKPRAKKAPAAELPAVVYASRQHRRSTERRDVKRATRPGLRPMPKGGFLAMIRAKLPGGPGVYGRHLTEFLTPTRAHPHEGTFHATKGVRYRRVAM